MKLEIAKLWCDALRSGEYEQGQMSLKDNNQYCCLGVLCQVAKDNGATVVEVNRNGYCSFDNCDEYLPESVKNWAGLKTDNGFVPSNDVCLTYTNDSLHKSFEEIADIIEENAEEL